MDANPALSYIQDYYMNKNLKGLRQLPKIFASKPSFNVNREISIEDFVSSLIETGLELTENEYQVSSQAAVCCDRSAPAERHEHR